MEIRPIEPADTETVATYHANAWKIAYEGLVPDETIQAMGFDTRLRMWASYFAGPGQPSSQVLVADVDGKAVGHVMVNDDQLLHLYLDPEHWGNGYGRALLREGMGLMRSKGFASAELATLNVPEQPAYQLYLSEGWSPGEVQESEICGGADEVTMRVSL